MLLNTGKHAAMVQINGGTTVEARGRSYGIVANVAYRNYPWDFVLRYPESSSESTGISMSPKATITVPEGDVYKRQDLHSSVSLPTRTTAARKQSRS